MFSKTSREGYLMIDHQASPGLPKGFMQSLGLESLEVPGGKRLDGATLTCCGCGGVYFKNQSRLRDRHYCHLCDSYMCDNCALMVKLGHPHVPRAKILDQAEKLAYREQQNSLVSRFSIKG